MMNNEPSRERSRSGRRGRAVLVGRGLDEDGGHVRITLSDGMRLVGGSEGTHAKMQQQAMRLRDELKRRGLRLGTATREEYEEISRIVAGLSG